MAGEAAVLQEPVGEKTGEAILTPDDVTFPCGLCRQPARRGGCLGGGTLLYVEIPAGRGGKERKITACKPPHTSRQYFGPGAVNGKPICCKIGGRVPLTTGGTKVIAPAKATERLP